MEKILFLTTIPSFYKNLLFNKLSEDTDVKVFFSNYLEFERNNDFFSYQNHSLTLKRSSNLLRNVITLYKAARKAERVYYGGWDLKYFWLLIWLTPKRKNRVMVESSIYEYTDNGLKKKILNFAKKIF